MPNFLVRFGDQGKLCDTRFHLMICLTFQKTDTISSSRKVMACIVAATSQLVSSCRILHALFETKWACILVTILLKFVEVSFWIFFCHCSELSHYNPERKVAPFRFPGSSALPFAGGVLQIETCNPCTWQVSSFLHCSTLCRQWLALQKQPMTPKYLEYLTLTRQGHRLKVYQVCTTNKWKNVI